MSVNGGLSASTLSGLSGPSSGVTFGGLASGLDTNSIIQALTKADQIPIQRLQTQQQDLLGQKTIYSQLQQALSGLNTAASALDTPGSFSAFTANSSVSSVASVTLSGGTATAGVYNLTVDQLAQAHKISSAAQTDVTTGLSKTGTFVVNGLAINVTASDSLTSIAQKVNGANTGVTASLINGGTGNAYLTFTSNSTGVAGKVQLSDVSGNVLSSLGVLTGATGVRETLANGATSTSFSSQTTAVGTLLNTTIPSATIQINGKPVTINSATDSLQQIANNINAAGAGVTATVRPVTSGSTTTYKLDIVGASGTPTFTDDQNVLGSIGVLQQGYGSELIKAQDASYHLDGVALTSSTNTITNAIPGATLTLQSATSTTNGTTTVASSTISVNADTSGIAAKITALANAYNAVNDLIAADSQVDPTTFNTGPLFGDQVAQQVESQLGGILFNNVPGLSGNYTNLASIGFSLDTSADIQVDQAALTKAINTNPSAVAALFKSVGSSGNPDLTYVTSTSKSKASGAAQYAVNITQLATQGSYTGEVAQTSPTTQPEVLTFSGALFSNTPYKLTVASGSQASDIVHLINTDSKLSGVLTASLDNNGKLQLTSKKYGTNGNFTAVSNITAAADNSGLGVGSLGSVIAGVDVAGTINGEAATGSGQFLTGKSGNSTTDGLQIQYSGKTLGAIGNLQFTKGIGPVYSDLANQFTDPTNGLIVSSQNSLQAQYDFLQTEVDEQTGSMNQKIRDLQAKYSAMEQTVSAYKSQGQRLTAMFG